MKTFSRILVALSLVCIAMHVLAEDVTSGTSSSSSASSEVHEPKTTKVVMHTALGDIAMLLEVERAPITTRNFLRYVDQKRFDGMVFYRAVKVGMTGEYGMVQGGLHAHPEKLLKPIAHEPTNVTGLSHVNGAVSMARLAPGTATAEFFIVLGDLVSLDAQPGGDGDNAGYAVFGHVADGMDVVKAILERPCSNSGEGVFKGQMIKVPVKVTSVRRAE